jgi:hypothetical protein
VQTASADSRRGPAGSPRYLIWIGLSLGACTCSTETGHGPQAKVRDQAERGAPTSDPAEVAPLPAELEAKIVFLMPQEDMGSRVAIDPLVELSKDIEAIVCGLYARHEIAAVPLSVFVGVKPGGRMKVWAVGIEEPLEPAEASLLEQRASTAKAPSVSAPIALAFSYPRKAKPTAGAGPLPLAWKDAAKTAGRTLMIPDGMFSVVWPD